MEARAAGARLAARYYDGTNTDRWGAKRPDSTATALATDMNLGVVFDDTLTVKCDGTTPGKCGLAGHTGVVGLSPVRIVGNSASAEIAVFFWTPPAERTTAFKPELPGIVGQYTLERDASEAWRVTNVRWAMK
jgi:hypothetical protein